LGDLRDGVRVGSGFRNEGGRPAAAGDCGHGLLADRAEIQEGVGGVGAAGADRNLSLYQQLPAGGAERRWTEQRGGRGVGSHKGAY